MPSELPSLPEPLPGPVVDTHCHLDATEEYSGLSAQRALDDAAEVNVRRVVQVGCDVDSSLWAVEAARRWPTVVASVAMHPNDAARLGRTALPAALDTIEAMVTQPGVRGVGETGLDFFRTRDEAGQRLQRESFAAHIAWAKTYDKTLVIHDRDAEFARACLDRGAHLSFAGTVTFKPNEHLRDAVRLAPRDRVVVETDAPYLTPVPFRGRPNASYLIPHTVRFLADLLGADVAELCRDLDANAEAAFGGSW